MKTSLFDEILKAKLGEEVPQEEQKKTSTPPPRVETFNFGSFNFKQKISFKTSAYKKTPPKAPKIKVEPPKEIIKKPRTFSKTQLQAIKVFRSLGTTEITDCSTDGDIKTIFRKLAKKYHPDMAPGKESLFRELTDAYELFFKDTQQ